MMKITTIKKQIGMASLGVILLSAGAASAATLVSWSLSTLTPGNQPDFTNYVATGTLYSDQDVVAGTNNNAAYQHSAISVTGAAGSFPGNTGSSLQPEGYFYTLFSTPTLTFSYTAMSDIPAFEFVVIGGGATAMSGSDTTITVNGNVLTASFQAIENYVDMESTDYGSYDTGYVWSVGDAQIQAGDVIEVSASFGIHTALAALQLNATPEPSSCLLGAFAVMAMGFRRRR